MNRDWRSVLNSLGLSDEKPDIGPRRNFFVRIPAGPSDKLLPKGVDWEAMDRYNVAYRALCGILYNSVPKSGHPGGSISSGHIVQSLLFSIMKYDFSNPVEPANDVLMYAAGHKAMGLYAMWALRNECARIGAPELLPSKVNHQLRLEDLLGFRRNPTQDTPLFKELGAKPLDGHPTPATPHFKLASGPSGTGVPVSLGYALGALDAYGEKAPHVHVLEGEGGATPGRVYESLAAAASACLWNVTLHLDWNQASIDSDRVCREKGKPGDYVQWEPAELFFINDWNVIVVEDGFDFRQVLAAQRVAALCRNTQPTAVVYRTIKGWKYGIEGRKSHGAGHDYYSEAFYNFLSEFEGVFGVKFPRFDGKRDPVKEEKLFFDYLMLIRNVFEGDKGPARPMGAMLKERKAEFEAEKRERRKEAPSLGAIYDSKEVSYDTAPDGLKLSPGVKTTLRGHLAECLRYLNKVSGGALIGSSADLYGSTSLLNLGKDFPQGFYNAVENPGSRMIAVGGICEDAMGGFMAGLSSFGSHMGVSSSYGAFITPLEHIYCRTHAISQQTKREVTDEPTYTWIMINAHAGIKTGEDGPTHADPQPLQLLQGNFPKGSLITLTPWEPNEIWPLLVEGLKKRPAVLAPFVTRPTETVPDRKALRLAPAERAVEGMYLIREADPSKKCHGTVVIQGSGVANTFFFEVLPRLDEEGYNFNVYYVASAELFDMLPESRQREIYPEERAREAVGITGFTLPTMDRWILSARGREMTLYPHRAGRYLGSGQAHKVLEEAGMHAEGQYRMLVEYAASRG